MEQRLTLRTNTSSYTIDDIKDEIAECVALLEDIGVTSVRDNSYNVKLSTRKTKTFGTCHKNSDNNYTITINEHYLRLAKPENVHNLIAHEVLHSVPGCMNHKEPWKKVARKMNANYEFTPIKRLGHDDNYSQKYLNSHRRKLENRYEVICDACGHTWKYKRSCRVVQQAPLGKCTCPYCRSKNFTVDTLF